MMSPHRLGTVRSPDPATIHLGHSGVARTGVSFPMQKTRDPLFHHGEVTVRWTVRQR